jgi:hypothetical protein
MVLPMVETQIGMCGLTRDSKRVHESILSRCVALEPSALSSCARHLGF